MDRQLDQSHPKVISIIYICTKARFSFEDMCHLCVRGLCGCCKSELESIHLTAAEYQQLKDRVITDIIQGQNIFTKTTPEVYTHTYTHTLSLLP